MTNADGETGREWRVEEGAYTKGNHYVVGPSGRWIMAGTKQDAESLAQYLNNTVAEHYERNFPRPRKESPND